jgi:hypothetical protein
MVELPMPHRRATCRPTTRTVIAPSRSPLIRFGTPRQPLPNLTAQHTRRRAALNSTGSA